MAAKSWTVVETDGGEYSDGLRLGPADFGEAGKNAHLRAKTLRGGLSDGVEIIEVDNGAIRFTVIPTRGMGLHNLSLIDGRSVGWRSPIRGPVHPKFVNLYDPSGLGWLDGFDEFLCRCGLESNGAPEFDAAGKLLYPLHGKIANRPAHRVVVSFDEATQEIAITGEVEESRLFFSKLRLTTTIRAKLGEAKLSIRDEVTNFAATPGEMELLYHINFGGDLLNEGSQVVAPIKQLAPRNAHAALDLDRWDKYPAPQTGFAEQVYFLELAADAAGQSQVLLRNRDTSLGATVHADVRQLPCFTIWKNPAALADGYVTGLEPGTNYPNPRSFEKQQSRVVPLAPGQTRTFDVSIELHANAAAVQHATAAIGKLQAGVEPVIHHKAPENWCAG
jgi:galactose mutarotase-like enzyme